MKKLMYSNVKQNKGITMIALIITIILLLLLAAIAVYTISENNAINQEKENQRKFEIAQEEEKLRKEVLEWKLINVNGTPTLKKYLDDIYGTENVEQVENENLKVTVPSGNEYYVDANENVAFIGSNVEQEDISIKLDKDKIEITKGDKTTDTITAKLENATGTLSWESSNPDVAEIRNTTGNNTEVTGTIYLKNVGTAKITVSYGKVEATCYVIIKEKESQISYWTQDGMYVKDETHGTQLVVGQDVIGYNVEYTNSDNKKSDWAVLGAEDGKLLLVSKYNVKDNVKIGGMIANQVDKCECGYNDGVAKLNEICEEYKDNNLADQARSIKVDDMNRIVKFIPSTHAAAASANQVQEYGTRVSYVMTSENWNNTKFYGYFEYRNLDNGINGTYSGSKGVPFFYPVGNEGVNLKPGDAALTYTHTSYQYEPLSSSNEQKGYGYIQKNTKAYTVLFGECLGWGQDGCYWFADQYIGCGNDGVYFGLRTLTDTKKVWGGILWFTQSATGSYPRNAGVKAVVVLKPEVKVEMDEPTVANEKKTVTISISK